MKKQTEVVDFRKQKEEYKLIKAKSWPIRAFYYAIVITMALGLLLVPANTSRVNADELEWSDVVTPNQEKWVLAPGSDMTGVASVAGGNPVYVTGFGAEDAEVGGEIIPQVWKSSDSGATWKEITGKVEDAENLPGGTFERFNLVACAPDDADFVAVAGWLSGVQVVVVSEDGGTNFEYAGEIDIDEIYWLAISPEVKDNRYIAACGYLGAEGMVYSLEVGGYAGWTDARYDGWDNEDDGIVGNEITSEAVTQIVFTPSFVDDHTVLAVTLTDDGFTYLQSGTWNTSDGWNEEAGFKEAVLVTEAHYSTLVRSLLPAATASVTLPQDYQGRHKDKRYAWVVVNTEETIEDQVWGGWIFRVKDASVKEIDWQPEGHPWLTPVSYLGTIDEGKALVGELPDEDVILDLLWSGEMDCVEGRQVLRNDGIEKMDICCSGWEEACKPPTGLLVPLPVYVAPNKAYALGVGLGFLPEDILISIGIGYPVYSDESAFSFSFDDGDNWNQLSLVDTDVDYLSDVAVSPDCNKVMLVSANYWEEEPEGFCDYDSVWLKAEELSEAEEYSDAWIRTWCGILEYDYGLLRLAPEDEKGETVYLVDWLTDTVYWNEAEGLDCWEDGRATVDEIVDLAVKDAATIYALDFSGDVAMSDDYGATASWDDEVDSELDQDGHTIAVMGDYVLVGGEDGTVTYSDDAGESFTRLGDKGELDEMVHVAFDSYFDENKTVYGAVTGGDGGIWRWVIDEDSSWEDLDATPTLDQMGGDGDDPLDVAYFGIVLDRAEGNPMTSASTGSVLYATYFYYDEDEDEWYTGVARCLNPAKEVCCDDLDWDYLHEDLTVGTDDAQAFILEPSNLKICGCLTSDTNSKLWAIDDFYYDIEDGENTLWVYEDCVAKEGITLLSPADGATVPSDPCYCWNDDFVLKWERLCEACKYDIKIALDPDFNEVKEKWLAYEPEEGKTPSLVVENLALGTGSCGTTFYWKVRAVEAESNDVIRSPWSEARSFTVEAGPEATCEVVSPSSGATNVRTDNVSFTWKAVPDTDTYDFVLSKDAELSTPVDSRTGLTGTAYATNATLEHNTPYFWRVMASANGNVLCQSSISTFTTAPEAPAPPVKEEPRTPPWVWVIIGIGAVLVIVVVVLIFRTRRV